MTGSRSYGNITVPKSCLSYPDPMRHRKKPFSYFVLNPCYITPCFVNQCFITQCFNQCFITPCFINPCFVNPVQSMSYHMPKNTRCPWETHITWLLQTGCSCMCVWVHVLAFCGTWFLLSATATSEWDSASVLSFCCHIKEHLTEVQLEVAL